MEQIWNTSQYHKTSIENLLKTRGGAGREDGVGPFGKTKIAEGHKTKTPAFRNQNGNKQRSNEIIRKYRKMMVVLRFPKLFLVII